MHKLTNDRMRWGASALLAGAAIGAAALLGVRHRPYPASVPQHPRVVSRCPPAVRDMPTASYAHRVHQFSEEHARVTIYNRQTGRVVWQHAVTYLSQTIWSPDRRAFALVEDAPGSAVAAFRLLVWRAGERARIYSAIPPLPYFDAIGALEWSPDDKRLLILGARSQGGSDVGELWCLDVDRGKSAAMTAYPERAVAEAHWIGLRRIRMWTISYGQRNGTEEAVNDQLPCEWTCP